MFDDLAKLQARLRAFAAVRDWNKFHTPKNLALALTSEVGEVADVLRFLTDEQERALADDPERKTELETELADVLIFLVRLADVVGIDLLSATHRKIDLNEVKYPADRAFGNALKSADLLRLDLSEDRPQGAVQCRSSFSRHSGTPMLAFTGATPSTRRSPSPRRHANPL